ncbi:MAG: glycosyltransferase [FCB group bacterium]
MDIINQVFDICFISMSDISTDARTINFAKTFAKNSKKVCVISYCSNKDIIKFSKNNILLLPVPKPLYKKAFLKTYHFQKWIKNNYTNIKAKNYWAEDIYSLYPASKLSKVHKGKLIYDSREIYSALGPLHRNPFKQKVLSRFEKRLIKYVNEIVVTGVMDAEYLKEYFQKDIPVHVVQNLPYYKEKINSNILREKYGIPQDKFIIIYQGMLLPGRGIIKIVEALNHLPDAVFCILGEGNYKNKILETAENLKLANKVFFCGVVPYYELHKWTSSADVGTVFIEPISFSYELSLPNKLFEYCMARIPSLVSDLPAMRAVLNEYPIGKIISVESTAEDIANTIRELASNEKKEQYLKACNQASKIFCYETQEEKILSIAKV